MTIHEPIQAMIWQCMNHYDYENATFLAERLHSEVANEESLYAVTSCYYRTGQFEAVKFLLTKECRQTPRLKFLLAKCYLDTNRYNEAESTLMGNIFTNKNTISDLVAQYGETAPFALQLLAKIYSKTEREPLAKDALKKALKLNPFLWVSFKNLCDMDYFADPAETFSKSDANNIFKDFNESKNEYAASKLNVLTQQTENTAGRNTFLQTPPPHLVPRSLSSTAPSPLHFGNYLTPSLFSAHHTATVAIPQSKNTPLPLPLQQTPPPAAPPSQLSAVDSISPKFGVMKLESSMVTPTLSLTPLMSPLISAQQPPPLQKKLMLNAVKENKKKRTCRLSQNFLPKKKMKDSLLMLLKDIASAYVNIAKFESEAAIEKLERLPSDHLSSAYIQSLIGRTLFETMHYEKAKEVYQALMFKNPYYVQAADFYSTTLWHLNDESTLSSLADLCTSMHRNSAYSLCAVGNCFSLQKRHSQAIQYFKRATMIDKSFAYPYSLMGHEYIYIQEFENGIQSFRTALSINKRHYPSWTGLGLIYYKQEKMKMAEVYFNKAYNINKTSSVLLCHIGIVENSLGKHEKALNTLNLALDKQPKSELCKYNRAYVLYCMQHYQDALADLEELRIQAPKEAQIYILMGKVFKKLGDSQQAMVYFSWATDIDPKGNLSELNKIGDHFEMHDDNNL